ncbi:hypothetical protein PLESTB_001381400 [Pleodorina starrii]|uniref:Protein kintoun n=1 Tax=Pleodorina starrii TaxID=330485 RepID=A0A9W6BV49_9CHLO|nr:hypothetical protein PLESTM_000403800 [Pleodorina starrii]GLC58623.1 hypothetical protein PLESTB_001381400 [Pleodorina starrii]GLC67470.1 hypothetical protein PLESTF_000561000 [Pleodorina starrii]
MEPATRDSGSLDKGLKDLNLTNEELTKFEKAFKDPEFLKLFEEYAKEVSDPKVKEETDKYLRQLEEQGRAEDVYGKGVQLITPKPGLVLKTKVLGAKEGGGPAAKGAADPGSGAAGGGGRRDSLPVGQKVFINVCTSDKVERYSLKEAQDASGRVGKQLSIPITTGPGRQGTDKHGQPAAVYDVVVHPDTIEFAASRSQVMSTLAEMALEQVETLSRSHLTRNWRRLNSRYKATEGAAEPPVVCVRTGEGGEAVEGRLKPRADVPGLDVPGAKAAAADAGAVADAAEGGGGGSAKAPASRSAFSFDKQRGQQRSQQQQRQQQEEVKDPSQPGYRHPDGCRTPEWTLVHRGQTDLAAAWGDAGRGLALDASVPKELLIRVTLPEVASAAAVDLDVGQRRLTIKVPGKYLLDIVLPYAVDDDKGKAKFDKARKQLEITLPVVPPPPPTRAPAAAAAAAPLVQELPGGPREQPQQQLPGEGLATAAEGRTVAPPAGGERGVEEEEEEEEAGPVAAAGGAVDGEGGGPAEGREATAAAVAVAGRSAGGSAEASRRGEEEQPQHRGRTEGQAEVEGRDEEERRAPSMTENERRWRELHERRAPTGGDDGGGAAAAEARDAATAGGGPPADDAVQSAEAGQCRTDSADASVACAAAGAAAAAAAAAAVSEPTVLLKPRLRRDVAMELD